jgi:hypothetical protein
VAVGLLISAQAAFGGWTRQPISRRHGGLSGVSCSSAKACTAVGYQVKRFGSPGLTLVERWNGQRWSLQRAFNPRRTPDSSLVAVSCPSAKTCMAVGETDDSHVDHFVPLVERWNGHRWSIQRVPHGNNWYLYGVSCVSATACVAVGLRDDPASHRVLTLAEHWNGHRWSIQRTTNPMGAHNARLQAVSCSSAARCTAVGSTGPNSTLPLVERWDGRRWRIQRSPHPADEEVRLLGVSCPSASDCIAVGYLYSGQALPLMERWNGERWAIQSSSQPAGAQDHILYGVSCAAASACTAVGQRATGYDSNTPLAERWNGHNWTPQHVVGQANGTSLLEAVSCPSPARCTAVGQAGDPRIGREAPMAERYS